MVTTGPYALFPHPIYTFGGVTLAGLLVALPVSMGIKFVVLGVFAVVQSIRMSKETKEMSLQFGAEYKEYRARLRARWRL